jgi:hypothetical protein
MRYTTGMSTKQALTHKTAEKCRNFSQIKLEKDASKTVDWYRNCCYNSGLTTQRG